MTEPHRRKTADMRCKACNATLDDLECANKDVETGDYLDMCRECLAAGRIVCEVTMGETYEDFDTEWIETSEDIVRLCYGKETPNGDDDYGDGREE